MSCRIQLNIKFYLMYMPHKSTQDSKKKNNLLYKRAETPKYILWSPRFELITKSIRLHRG